MPTSQAPKGSASIEIVEPSFTYKNQSYTHHSGLGMQHIAVQRLIPKQIVILSVIAILLLAGLIINWHAAVLTLVAVITAYYFLQALFDCFLTYRSLSATHEIDVTDEMIKSHSKRWPTYTILCPLYKEPKVVPQFIRAMEKLDYPKDKLQILLLLEEDDKDTLKAVRKLRPGKQFIIEMVPDSLPKTKPKALNWGLKKATGTYTVIYDAEDIPDPKQLKRTAMGFETADPRIACLQSKLDYYNSRQNVLTRVFTAEYALWFDLVLPGLQSIKAPIPLGGTSNHFPTELLRELGGWDAFNVTEDADLGIRLAKQGFRTAIVNSFTYEEASSRYKGWFKQRRRWIKGYMQTYFVHTRRVRDFRTTSRRSGLIFQMVVGGKIALLFINPLTLLLTILYYVFRSSIGGTVESFYPAPILTMAVLSFVIGNFLYVYYYMLGCAKRDHYQMIKFAYLVPIYWLMMSAAAYAALYELIFHPHYWNKTAHGHHLVAGKNLKHSALDALGYDAALAPTEDEDAA